jgi:hypothetical protein
MRATILGSTRKLRAMQSGEPFVTYLELRESAADGSVGSGLSHSSKGLVLLHVLELAKHRGRARQRLDAALSFGASPAALQRTAGRSHCPTCAATDNRKASGVTRTASRKIVRDLDEVQNHLAYRQPDAPKVLIGQGLGTLWCLAYACETGWGRRARDVVTLLTPRFDLPKAPADGRLVQESRSSSAPHGMGRGAVDDDASGAALKNDPLAHGIVTLRAGG